MPSLPNPDRNLLDGLASFWNKYFQDTSFTQAYFQAGQIMLGQVYLELCQSVLGTSLNHIPLFSKKYYQYLPVREDQVAYLEGGSTGDDRFVYTPPQPIAQANLLMNAVIIPTKTLDYLIDYDVENGDIAFHIDPFNVDGMNNSLTNFPVRTVQVVGNAAVVNLRNVDWRTLGAKPGDSLWFAYPSTSTPKVVQILAIDSTTNRMMLSENLQEFGINLAGKTFNIYVVRIPYDYQQVGVITPQEVQAFESIGVTTNTTTKTLTLVTPPATMTPADGQFVYLVDAAEPRNNCYAKITNISGPTWTLGLIDNFRASAGPWTAYLVDHGPAPVGNTPTFPFPNTLIDQGSLLVTGRRAVARVLLNTTTPIPGSTGYNIDTVANTVTYPVGGAVSENVDYAIDYFNGLITYLTIWDPTLNSASDYTWKLLVTTEAYTFKGNFTAFASYNAGDVVISSGNYYVAYTAFTAGASFNITNWAPYQQPFGADNTFQLREIAIWAPDVLIDQNALYQNYGYLLGYQKPSSEAYRAFLQGVSQLFLLGPTIERFESALNVVAGLPVVRDDGEILESYDSGFEVISVLSDTTLGNGGQLIDAANGRDGIFDGIANTFTSATAGFFASDVGAVLRVMTPTGFAEYAVTSVSSNGQTAGVAPSPPTSTDVAWAYSHNLLHQHFRVNSANVTYLFSDSDIDSNIVISSAFDAKDVGSFRIISIISPKEVVLETPYGFIDATGLNWRLTKTKVQTVVTSRTTYTLPISVPMKATVTNPANFGIFAFDAFDAFSAAITVSDYISDPTWWHHVDIPQELLTLINDAPGRRIVTPDLIPHIVNAIDQAVINDFGLYVGKDDTGQPGISREGQVTWLGGGWLHLDFAAGASTIPGARPKDVGEYITIDTGKYKGYYQILAISPDNLSIQVDRFPPAAVASIAPPQIISDARLPPILYRRTVAYVLMDRFLKYHALHINIDTGSNLSVDFLGEVAQIVQQAKPGWVYVYLEPATSFTDIMTMTDSDYEITFGPWYVDHIHLIDNDFTGATLDINGEYHYHISSSQSGVGAGASAVITLTPVFGYVPDRDFFVFGRFSVGTAFGKPLDEGVNYSFDRTTGIITVPHLDAAAYTFNYVVVGLKQHAYAVDWWTTISLTGETPDCVHGADPLLYLPDPSVMNPGDYGFVDRPIEIAIT